MRFALPCAVLLCGHLLGLSAMADQDTQHGEQVVPANRASVDAPARRHEKAPWFELSNLRKEGPFGEIALDFRRIGEGSGHDVVLVVKGANGRQEYRSIGRSPFSAKQGSVQGKSWFGARPGNEIEVWLEQHQRLGLKPIRMKVSKSISLGKAVRPTLAREWTPEEQNEFDSWQKSTTPPPPPPNGYQLVQADTKLLPGMPVLAGRMGNWEPAEVIELRKNGTLSVKFSATEHIVPLVHRWVAVDGKTLEAGRSNPSQFRPSVKVLAGGTSPVPDGLLPIATSTPIVKGAPVAAERFGKWQDAIVVEIHKSGKLRLHWDSLPSAFDQDYDRSSVMIRPETLEALKKLGAAEEFAARVAVHENPFDTEPARRRPHLKSYPIDIPIPQNATRVTTETPLEPGVRLGCAWGRRWHVVTVLDLNDDGTLKIHWNKFSDAWDGDALRDHLIIEKEVLAKLESKYERVAAKSTATSGAPSQGDIFKVVLKSFGTRKVAVTQSVMEVTGLDLKDAKEFVENTPFTVKQNLSKTAAETLRATLQAAGGTVAIELQ